MKVKHNLRILMAKKRIKSIRELSEQSGIYVITLRNFSSYVHKKLDPELIAELCKFFECKIEDLLYLEDEGQVS